MQRPEGHRKNFGKAKEGHWSFQQNNVHFWDYSSRYMGISYRDARVEAENPLGRVLEKMQVRK